MSSSSSCPWPALLSCCLARPALQVLRKHEGPRQFVYYSKTARHKSLQRESWQGKSPGLSAAHQSCTGPRPSPTRATQSSLEPHQPAQQRQFAAPPVAPPCPPVPLLSTVSQHKEEKSSAQSQHAVQQHQQATKDMSRLGPAERPCAPPLPPMPWDVTSHRASVSLPQQEHQQQQVVQQRQALQSQRKQGVVKTQTAAAPPAPPLPPLPWTALASQSLAGGPSLASSHQQQQEQQQQQQQQQHQEQLFERLPSQFAAPPVPPPLPSSCKPSTRAQASKEKARCGSPPQQSQLKRASSKRQSEGQAPASDMHRLVAQQAAAAALRRQQQQDKPEPCARMPQEAALIVSAADQLVILQPECLDVGLGLPAT